MCQAEYGTCSRREEDYGRTGTVQVTQSKQQTRDAPRDIQIPKLAVAVWLRLSGSEGCAEGSNWVGCRSNFRRLTSLQHRNSSGSSCGGSRTLG